LFLLFVQVRVFRLVCEQSVEERIVSRAQRKVGTWGHAQQSGDMEAAAAFQVFLVPTPHHLACVQLLLLVSAFSCIWTRW
jgi:hypothetical protein